MHSGRLTARAWAAIFVATGGAPPSDLSWMPAHTVAADVGRRRLGNGELLSARDRFGNEEARASGGGAGTGLEPALAGGPCRTAAPAAEADEGDDADGQSMVLDAEDKEQLDRIVAEMGGEAADAGGEQLAGRAELRKKLAQQTAKMVSKRLKAKRGA